MTLKSDAAGETLARRLSAVGVRTEEEFLNRAATATSRDQLSRLTGIDAARLFTWVTRVDLMRICGIGPQYATLLHSAGVDTVQDLARQNVANLAEVLAVVVARMNRPKIAPAEPQVASWIDQAKRLQPKVSY